MTTQALAPLNLVPQGYGKYFSIIPGEWRNRVFHLLTTGQGLNIDFFPIVGLASFMGGVFVAPAIDRRFPDLKRCCRVIFKATILIPVLGGAHLVALACGVHFTAVTFMASVSIGFVIGAKVTSYPSEKRNDEFRPTVEIINRRRVKTQLNTLDLADKKLTDQQLQKMADEGKLEAVQCLFLCLNPDISAKKLLEIVGKRCPKLVWLDIGYNQQFTGPHLKEWVTSEGFSSLKVLELRDTNLTKEDLEYMIEQPWVQQIAGINLIENGQLYFPPDNVFKLEKLRENLPEDGWTGHGGSRDAFNGKGIFIATYFDDHVNKGETFQQLLKAGDLHFIRH